MQQFVGLVSNLLQGLPMSGTTFSLDCHILYLKSMCIVPVPSSVCIRVYMCKCVRACIHVRVVCMCIYMCSVFSMYICGHDVGDCVGMCVVCMYV